MTDRNPERSSLGFALWVALVATLIVTLTFRLLFGMAWYAGVMIAAFTFAVVFGFVVRVQRMNG